MCWEDDGGWLVNSNLEGCVWHGIRLTDPDRSLLDRAVQTCNPAHFSRPDAFTSETSDMCAQAVAYEMEILQFCTCLRHEEIYQFRYVLSRWTCVLRSS